MSMIFLRRINEPLYSPSNFKPRKYNLFLVVFTLFDQSYVALNWIKIMEKITEQDKLIQWVRKESRT